jgi:hypothetical protein
MLVAVAQRPQAHLRGADETQRVEVGRPAAHPPVQAGRRGAVTARAHQPAERLAGPEGLTDAHDGANRLVGREQAFRVLDRHDADAGDPTGEVDDAGAGGAHPLAGPPQQVDAPMTGEPGLCGWRETLPHLRRATQGPGPARVRLCAARRARREDEPGDDEAEHGQASYGVHPGSIARGG